MMITKRALQLIVVGSMLFGSTAVLGEGPAPAPGKGSESSNPQCVSWHSEARYGAYGYDHLVEIENGCDHAVTCAVKTDVNPEPTQARVAAKDKATVMTFRGSPAREFKADVRCKSEG